MGVFSTAGPTRPRPARHSVRFIFTSTVAVPTACMVLLWAVAAGIVLANPLSGHGTRAQGHRELVGIVLIVAAGLVVVVAALILTGSFARRLSQDISGLAATAHRLADEQLPQLIERQRAGEKVSQAALADLFTLDHLTTRMRRHAESLTILSGAAPGRTWTEPVPIIDIIRAAVAEVEDYKRVTVFTMAEDAVTGPAVADMIHLLAELVENATLFSPSTSRVEVRAERVANGFAIEIDDRGLGIAPDQLADINQQLAKPPDFDLANADRLGLFVAGRLAARHNVRVSLRPSPFGGTTAIVLMPGSIVVVPGEPAQLAGQAALGAPAQLDLRPAEALALTTGQLTAQRPSHAAERPPSAPAPAESPEGTARAGQPAAGTYRGLPRRTRQASLSPHLRATQPGRPESAVNESAAAQASAREPEQARDLAASLQSGWLRGRQTDLPDAQQMTDIPAASRQDTEAPQGEEA